MLNNQEFETHFFVSDLHGTSGENLMSSLYEAGFRVLKEDFYVNVCGDITDGLQNEYSLIKALMLLDKEGQLNAIKGNHDFGPKTRGYMNANMSMPSYKMTNEQRKWVEKLPFELETEHFIMAHGIYIEQLPYPGLDSHIREMFSIWGSPCLDINKQSDWWGLSPINDKEIALGAYKKYYKNSYNYCHNSFKKDIYLGHFWPWVVKEKLDAQGVEYTEDDKGFVTCGKVNWVDSDVLNNVPHGSVKVKVVKYPKRR